jgi:hypothetical protein
MYIYHNYLNKSTYDSRVTLTLKYLFKSKYSSMIIINKTTRIGFFSNAYSDLKEISIDKTETRPVLLQYKT